MDTEQVVGEIKSLEERFNEQRNKEKKEEGSSKSGYYYTAVLGYIVAIVSIGFGFHKMFVYENPESLFEDSVNVYVGGDAFNYIINGTHATAYFVLALVFTVFASTMLILNKMGRMTK